MTTASWSDGEGLAPASYPYLDPVDHILDAEDIPGIVLGHVALSLGRDDPVEGDNRVSGTDPQLVCVDKRILFQNQPDRIGDLEVAVGFGRRHAEPVYHIATSRNPPGERAGQPFLPEPGYVAV